MALHNRVSRKELKERILQDPTPRKTVSFYCYFPISDPPAFRDEWYRQLAAFGVLGRIYVASEGINAQVSVPVAQFEAFRAYLYSIEPLYGLRLNVAVDDDGKSFYVLDIKGVRLYAAPRFYECVPPRRRHSHTSLSAPY